MMLFYRSTSPDYRLPPRDGVGCVVGGSNNGVASSSYHPSRVTENITWMIKFSVICVVLVGLGYWLVQIAGAQYLATLTSATLLSFLLVYIVWCLTVRRRRHPQNVNNSGAATTPSLPTTSSHLPPPPTHPAFKHYGMSMRDSSPPPSYDEVLRQMEEAAVAAALAASTSRQGAETLPAAPLAEQEEEAEVSQNVTRVNEAETTIPVEEDGEGGRQAVEPTLTTPPSDLSDVVISVPNRIESAR